MVELKEYNFSDLYEMSSGLSSKKEQAGHGSPFVSFRTVFNNYFLPNVLEDKMDTSLSEQEIYSVKADDILLTRTSETIDELGMSCVVLNYAPNATYSGFTKRLRPKVKDVVYSKYIVFYLRTKMFRKTMTNSAFMTLRASLNDEIFSYLKLYLPDYQTQVKIGDLLYSLNQKIALNNKTNTELENMAKIIYDYWFTQFDFPYKNGHPYKTSGGQMVYNEILKREIPTGWKGLKLEKCLSRIATGLNPRDKFVLGNGNIKYLTVKNLNTDGTIDFSNCDLIDEEALKLVHARSDIRKGDILFASIAPLGRCYLIQDTPKGWDINESVFSIRPNTDLISSIYLYMFFMDESFVKLAQSNSTGSVFKGIRINDLYSIPILVPAKQIMEKFSKTITPIMNMKYRVEKENKEFVELRDYILPLLMNGQIEVKE